MNRRYLVTTLLNTAFISVLIGNYSLCRCVTPRPSLALLLTPPPPPKKNSVSYQFVLRKSFCVTFSSKVNSSWCSSSCCQIQISWNICKAVSSRVKWPKTGTYPKRDSKKTWLKLPTFTSISGCK